MLNILAALIGRAWIIILAIIILGVLAGIYIYLGPMILIGLLLISVGAFFLIRMPAMWKIAILPIAIGAIVILLSTGGLI